MLRNGHFQEYNYKGNVKTAHEVNIRKYLDSLGNEKTDTMSIIFNYFDKKHKSMLMDYENRSTGGSSAYMRHEVINGKYELVESRGPFMENWHKIYSNDGKLREVHYSNVVRLYNAQGKLYCTITYKSLISKKIEKYEHIYYDKKGKDTAIISTDRYFNVISHIKKVYDKRGNLTEEYKNGELTSYHRYDSKGRLLADSSVCGENTYTSDSPRNIIHHHKTNRCTSSKNTKVILEKYEYEKNGGKTVQEFENGELDNVKRYDKNGNRTYFRRYACCPKIECKDKYDKKNRKIESISTYFNDNETNTYVEKYINGENDPLNGEKYRNDTLISINFHEEKRVGNKLISTTIKGEEDDTLKGKLNIDTITSVTTFDKDDKILTKCSYDKSGETGCTRYTYNEQGQLLSIVHDKPYLYNYYRYMTRIDYQYDEHHNLVSETQKNGDKIVSQTTNQYDADNHLVDSKYVDTDCGSYTLTKYDKVGNVIEQVRTSNGVETIIKSGKSTKAYKNPIYIHTTTYTYYDE